MAYKEAAYRAANEGVPNQLPFLSEDLVFEDATGCRTIYGRDDFIEFAGVVFGESDPSRLLTVFVNAEESLDQYYWEGLPVDWLDRVRVGPDGVERVSLAVAVEVARFEKADVMDYDAIESLVDRYLAFWNGGSGGPPDLLYASDCRH